MEEFKTYIVMAVGAVFTMLALDYAVDKWN